MVIRWVVVLLGVVLTSSRTTAQFGYNNGGGYGSNGYGSYPYGYQYPSYGYYPSYPSYGYPSSYPYYLLSPQVYNPNSYYGNGLNHAYASSSGGTATAQATSSFGFGGFFG